MKKLIALTSTLALLALATPAFASDNEIEVKNYNDAYVKNDVVVGSNTGANWAMGGDGGIGGNSGYTKAKDSSTANGGDANGGNGGSNSGDILTGDATSKSKIENVVNSNDTKVKTNCGCEGDVEVKNRNNAKVKNYVEVGANTGDNGVSGGIGGDAGGSGTTKAYNYSTANGGNANGGNGGTNSGDISTGDAKSKSKIVNVVNTNVTRIKRNGSSF